MLYKELSTYEEISLLSGPEEVETYTINRQALPIDERYIDLGISEEYDVYS